MSKDGNDKRYKGVNEGMRKWTKSWKRILASVLAVLLAVGTIDSSAFAVYASEAGELELSEGKADTEQESLELQVEAPVETYVPEAEDLPDNEELFAGYVEKQLYPGMDGGISLFADYGKTKLDGKNELIYNFLKTEIEKVAAGEVSSTEFNMSLDQLKITKIEYTAEDLGVTSIGTVSGGVVQLTSEAEKAIAEKVVGYDLSLINTCLLMDCPYELYWYDKTDGISLSPGYNFSYDPSTNVITKVVLQSGPTFQFSVASEYRSAAGSQYQTDTSTARAVQTAVDKARSIVNENQGKSDYQKLNAYREAICGLVSYNDAAAKEENDTPYGNPWQLIWVFDDDQDTKVVCEGYSKAFQYLCDLSEFSSGKIVCYTVTGTMGGGTGEGPHMWNIVTMDDGKNYLVDVTNCDDGTVGAPDKLFLVGASGTVDGGYTSSDVTYTYEDDIKALYGEGILELAGSKYEEKKNISECATLELKGEAVFGKTLKAVAQAKAEEEPGEFMYEWYRGEALMFTIPTDNTYNLTKEDIGQTITVKVIAENCEGTLFDATTTTVAKAPCPTGNNASKGIVDDDQDTFTFTGKSGVTYEYSLDGGKTWQEVPDSTYTINVGDKDYSVEDIQVRAKETDVYEAGAAISNSTPFTVSKPTSVPLTGNVALTGKLQYGETLTANVTDAPEGAKLTYSFYAEGETTPLQSGAESTYVLKGTDIGKKLLVKVTGEGYTGELTASTSGAVTKRTLTLKAEDQSKTYGEADPDLTYQITAGSLVNGDTLTGSLVREAGEDVNTYAIKQGELTHDYYNIAFTEGTFTIQPADYTADAPESVTLLQGVGSFTEPTFTGVKNELVPGTLTYSYDNQSGLAYAALVTKLAALPDKTEGTITYTFTPTLNGNYTDVKSGDITFTVKDVEFLVDGVAASAANAVTLKENPTYGDTWAEIVTIKKITAKAGDKKDDNPTFELDVPGTPNAGKQPFKVLYSGTIGSKRYTNVEVCSGEVNVAQKTLTVQAGTAKVSKAYNGTTDAGTLSGDLAVTGILSGDTGRVSVTAIPGVYTSPDVGGQKTLKATLSLSGDKSDNYTLAAGEINLPCEITPKAITPIVSFTGATSVSYTGKPIKPAFTVKDGDKVLPEEAYSAVFSNNTDAGTATLSVTAAAGGNYTWTSPATATFEITKIDFDGTKEAQTSSKYGNQGSVDLTSLIPEGGKLGTITVTNTDSILNGTPALNGKTLYYTLSADKTKVGKKATVTIPVTGMKNYNDFDITVTITAADKLTQSGFKFPASEQKKTYGDEDFVFAATGFAAGSAVSYQISDSTIAAVDGTTGKVHILKAGTATITATASETGDYQAASVSYTLTVGKRPLTWNASDLSAADKETAIGADRKATLYGSLKLSGILVADEKDAVFICPADKLQGTYEAVKAGSQKVALRWKDSETPVSLTGAKAENYLAPAALPTILGKITESKELPAPAESTAQIEYRLEMESGITEIPKDLAENSDLNTPKKIEEKMFKEIGARSAGVSETNRAVYEVTLTFKKADSSTWEKADSQNFPSGGITVTLPYPAGTGKNTHDFTVVHMFITDANNHRAGDIEYPSVTKTDAGIQFKVFSLSPISVGWKAIETKTNVSTGSSGGENGSAGSTGNSGATNSGSSGTTNAGSDGGSRPAASRLIAAKTGDSSPVTVYLILALAAAAGVVVILVKRKDRKK